MSDLTELTTEELLERRDAIDAEIEHRRLIEDALRQIDNVTTRVLRASGEEPGGTWSPRAGVHDAYPLGWVTEHKGKTWESLVSSNVWEPGVSGWREVTEGIPQWLQPTGAHDGYDLGDLVMWGGRFWRSVEDANVWEPGVYGWVEVDSAGEPIVPDEPEPPVEPTPEEPEPDPEPDPGYPEWVQPTGAHDTYGAGAIVIHKGQVWENHHGDGNNWEPGEYGWTLIE